MEGPESGNPGLGIHATDPGKHQAGDFLEARLRGNDKENRCFFVAFAFAGVTTLSFSPKFEAGPPALSFPRRGPSKNPLDPLFGTFSVDSCP
ncbi:MAG: hypothetical protein AAF471_03945, partial [Myxococcota bacterium]